MSDRWAATSCDDAIWSGYGGYPDQPKALGLVVCYARHPALRFREAYDLPCRWFYDSSPGCRNCPCIWEKIGHEQLEAR